MIRVVMLRVVSRMVTNILGLGIWGLVGVVGKGWIQLAVLEVEMGWGYTLSAPPLYRRMYRSTVVLLLDVE